jgi:hypothetical protein
MVAISRERRRQTERMIRSQGVATDANLTDNDRLIYAVGCLVCDDTGYLSGAALIAAMQDLPILSIAARILVRCGATPGSLVN